MAKQTFTTGQVLTAAQMTSLQQTAMGGGAATAKTASYTLVAADAGATVIMNSASATTITVNTSLFSAGDTVFIQNIGAGVSTITAGTATVNTASSLALAQYESGNLYFTAAGASIFSKADGAPASSAFVGAKVFTTANQTITNNTQTTVNFNSEDFDTDTFHDNSTNNSRLTIPAGKGGYYAITGQIILGSAAAEVRQQLKILKNGNMVLISEIGGFAGSVQPNISVATIVNLAATDYVELALYQATGINMTIPNTANSAYQFFQVQFLGA